MATFLLHHYLERSADLTPDHPAVVMGERRVTYRELDDLASRVASHLITSGVQRADRVALFAPKSVETVASIYGILKAGAAYVPIDPSSPAPRAESIARDCRVAAVVSDASRWALLSGELETDRLRLMLDVAEVGDLPARPFEPPRLIDADLAYILYTSGTTGHPKGVMRSHRSNVAPVEWAASTFEVSDRDHFSGHTPLHSSPHRFDLYVCAAVGGTLYPMAPHSVRLGATMAEFVHEHEITVWWSTSSALVMLVTQGGVTADALSSLRVVIFGAERFPTPHLRQLADLVPTATLYCSFGSTESGTCIYHKVDQIPDDSDEPIPIGRPCDNCECLVVRPDGSQANLGEEGELLVRSPGVMPGYWDRPELSARVLVQNPLHELYPDPCYRTGDLVVRGEDGQFRLRGRLDDRVKIRGYGVEPGEVEAALHSHVSVSEACVVAIPSNRWGHELVAYVGTIDGSLCSERSLKRHVARLLPRYMVPTKIHLLSSLPRKSTGKINRRALQKLASAGK